MDNISKKNTKAHSVGKKDTLSRSVGEKNTKTHKVWKEDTLSHNVGKKGTLKHKRGKHETGKARPHTRLNLVFLLDFLLCDTASGFLQTLKLQPKPISNLALNPNRT